MPMGRRCVVLALMAVVALSAWSCAVAPQAAAARQAATVIEVRYQQGPLTVDGDLKEWSDVPPLPIVDNQLSIAPLKLCWREDGLYGAANTVDSSIKSDLQQPWMGDGLQVFLETDAARAGQLTPNCLQLTFMPLPDSKEGKATISVGHTGGAWAMQPGLEPDSGITCAWRSTDAGYTLEFFIPARTLKPALMEPEASLGMLMMLRNGSLAQPVVAFVTTQTGTDVYQRPDMWALLKLVK